MARQMEGMHCLIRRDAIGEDLLEEPSAIWDGWRVVDERTGTIGEICGFLENPAQSLLEVNVIGRDKPVLVPVVDDIVLDVDIDRQEVRVSLPNGLLDL